MNGNDSQQGHDRCGAKTRSGGQCKLPSGHGTDHVGIGRCKRHGGSTPNHQKAAKRKQAEIAVETYGLPREIDPKDALIEELHRTAGHVAWLGQQVRDLEEGQISGRVGGAHGAFPSYEPNVLIRMYAAERTHLANVAKTCVSVGIEERRVKIAEEQGALMAQVIRGLLTDLKIEVTPEVQTLVRKQLTLVQGGAA